MSYVCSTVFVVVWLRLQYVSDRQPLVSISR
jgi:hypothetical protein